MNSREWRAAEIPAGNGHGTAYALARIYGALSRGGELDGVRILRSETIEAAIEEQVFGPDVIPRPAPHALRPGLHAAAGPDSRSAPIPEPSDTRARAAPSASPIPMPTWASDTL